MIYFAGPGIELVVFGIILAFFGWQQLFTLSDSLGMVMIQGLAVAALAGAVLNLMPHATRSGREWIPNDGLGILKCLFWKPTPRRKFFDDEEGEVKKKPERRDDSDDPADWWKRNR